MLMMLTKIQTCTLEIFRRRQKSFTFSGGRAIRSSAFFCSKPNFNRHYSQSPDVGRKSHESPVLLARETWLAEGSTWSERFHQNSPVFFLHGFLGFKDEFARFGQELATESHRRVVAFDARNHGDSPRTKSMDYYSMAEDIAYTMAELREKRAIFVAHSMGAMTALALALRKPDLVSGLFLIDVGMTDAPRIPQIKSFMNTLMQLPLDQTRSLRENRAAIAKILTSKNIEEFLIRERILPNIIKKDDLIQWRVNIAAFLNGSSGLLKVPSELFAESTVYDGPTFILAGESSDYVPLEDDHRILNFLPKAEIRRVQNAGHFVHYDQPNEFYRATLQFVHKLKT